MGLASDRTGITKKCLFFQKMFINIFIKMFVKTFWENVGPNFFL
jgi:hypothetical protein